ncbi:conserved hypothetical protein [Delftia acidovorans SPH-1]|uniref:YXWGXW repeat-containing protein n=2 Tax=Comamonadaceae TaxID=80864 RepID=A9BWG6_DELAS|nr:conserved hypothetical protein [Delftia acidovorans SPH-1]MCP4018124.1 YjbF family lipoprotein [Delftia sp.]MCP4529663.1 YjbF family lipoprotein [Delftia sp.]QPS74530.1 YXWGXW repeat-containing protein [Delftia acidovorans]
MTFKRIAAVGLASVGLASALALTGCVVAPERHPRPAPAVHVQERVMPEVIVEERGAPPAPGWHWVNGYWRWERDQWVWQRGHWVANTVPPMPPVIVEVRPAPPSPVHYWVPGHWVWRADINNWFWVKGQWHG